ncbi:MAG TPA: glucoamylase family protein, partial [Verrucomicrobiae bacterium]|nr:glucoamylase family protein [Verrucomicrobiae bacterium]
MKLTPVLAVFFFAASFQTALAIQTPTNVVGITGDQSVVLHWDRNTDPNLAGYNVYRSTTGVVGPFSLRTTSLLTSAGFVDLTAAVVNGQTNFYYVTAVDTSTNESAHSITVAAVPNVFANNDQFLDYVQQTCFDYFWYDANPVNGLVPDRSANGSPASIAAVGFGLTSIGIAIDHGWITRTQGVARVLTTLNTFLNGPQGPGTSGVIGYQGWFYHFLDMNTALRSGNSELSSIDTALLLGGILYAKQYFNGANTDETSIRTSADAIFNRVNWSWMARGGNAIAMGWQPTTGFSSFGNWVGYNEGMILYCLGMGTATNPLPASAWGVWTNGYTWATNYGQAYVPFPPLFGHEYSHCWIDFRHVADAYMNGHSSTYFVNSRRAALAEVDYSILNPMGFVGYSSNEWGLTASDDPSGYQVHGLPPAGFDDGTIAPTAAGGAMAFTPEYSLPALLYFYSHFRPRIWTAFSFRDAFNLGQGWYDTDELGIDQGPIVIMIENYRTQRPWKLFMQNAEAQRGLQQAGF